MGKHLFDKNWVVSIVSLFFAVILFISVSNENNSLRSIARTNNSASIDSSITISGVPVVLGEHDEGTYVSGMPETVSVRLSGPRNIINQLTTDNFSVQTESLVGFEPGVRAISFVVAGLPNTIEYKVTPDIFYGRISTKETKTFAIEYEVAENVADKGYEVKNVSLDVQEVTLSGAKNEMAKIDQVLVYVTTSEPKSMSFSGEYKIQILDVNGLPLDINPSIGQVNVAVEIVPQTFEVPLIVNPINEQDVYDYDYMLKNETAIIYGGHSSQIQSLNVFVDVKNLSEDGMVVGTVEVIEGVTIQPTTVDVQVNLTPNENYSTTTETVTESQSETETTTTSDR